MITSKPLYAAPANITMTLASLANNAAWQSAGVDNRTTLYEDAQVTLTFNSGASGLSISPIVNVYAVASDDGGTTWTAGASGTNSSFTMPPNSLGLPLLGSFPATAAQTQTMGPYSIAAAFGGRMPAQWAVVVENKTGAQGSATEAPTKTFLGVNTQYV